MRRFFVINGNLHLGTKCVILHDVITFFASRLDNLHLPFANVKQHLQKEHFCLVTAELITTKQFPLMSLNVIKLKSILRQKKWGHLSKISV